jgi:hypothetical protein
MRTNGVLVVFSVLVFLVSFGCGENHDSSKTVVKVQESQVFSMPEIPDVITFCDQQIDLTHFDAKERLDRELLSNTFYHSNTYQYFKRANRYFPKLEAILQEENMPTDLKYLCLIESGLTQATSPSGAKGFWQFMPASAREHGLKINSEVDERYHIEKSTRAACDYLKNAFEKFEDWSLTAAAYNRGVAGIESDLEKQHVDSYMDLYLNSETGRYFFRMLALKMIFDNPEAYGFQPDRMFLYAPRETRQLKVRNTISDLVRWSLERGSNYRELKVLNPWILGKSLTVRNEVYTIELPKK